MKENSNKIKRGKRRMNTESKPSEARCPKCDNFMETRKHKEILAFLKEKPYYYIQWDYCRPCKYVQHSDEFKKINYDFQWKLGYKKKKLI